MLLRSLPAGAAACRAACRRLAAAPSCAAPLLARRAAPVRCVRVRREEGATSHACLPCELHPLPVPDKQPLSRRVRRFSAPQRTFHVRGPLCAQASIVDAVSTQMKEAMKAKDATRLAALRNMRAAFLVAIKARAFACAARAQCRRGPRECAATAVARAHRRLRCAASGADAGPTVCSWLVAIKESAGTDTLPDDKAIETLRKLVKQRVDSIAQYSAGGRPELVAAEEAEMKLIESFLPALADAATTEKWVREAIAQLKADKPGDAGKVMGAVIKAHKGEVDNAVAKRLAEQILGGK
jgi:uncharacterized protein YqeY